MAVFRIEKTRDYTVMSNHHLPDNLSRNNFQFLLLMSMILNLLSLKSSETSLRLTSEYS